MSCCKGMKDAVQTERLKATRTRAQLTETQPDLSSQLKIIKLNVQLRDIVKQTGFIISTGFTDFSAEPQTQTVLFS